MDYRLERLYRLDRWLLSLTPLERGLLTLSIALAVNIPAIWAWQL
jgi:hypothetical protein